MNGVRKLVFLALAAVLPHAQVNAQVPEVLREAVRKAVVTNPEVQARWHGFRAAEAEQDVAKGGSYPQVDLTAGVRHEWRKRPGTEADDYTRRGASLSLNQMVYDGFFTRNEVARMGYARLARYYELLDASESASLEVVRAYGEVLRYRKLVRLAQQNYVEHKQVFEQIPERASAGVGRRVDLDQATGLFRGSPRPTAVSRKLLLREKV